MFLWSEYIAVVFVLSIPTEFLHKHEYLFVASKRLFLHKHEYLFVASKRLLVFFITITWLFTANYFLGNSKFISLQNHKLSPLQ